jgi:hypothetical protein
MLLDNLFDFINRTLLFCKKGDQLELCYLYSRKKGSSGAMLSVGLLLLWKNRPSSNRAKEACPLIDISYVYSVNFYNSWTHHNSQVAVGMMPFAGVHLREQP